MKIKLPKDVKIGKERTNGIMVGGLPVHASSAQLFLQCCGKEKKCHDTIAILPVSTATRSRNEIIDSISNEQAGKIFADHGWLVKGYNSNKYTRCPECSKKIKK